MPLAGRAEARRYSKFVRRTPFCQHIATLIQIHDGNPSLGCIDSVHEQRPYIAHVLL